MKYFELEPEVAGGFGTNTVLKDPSARPPQIIHFHYEFEVWLGDSILEAVSCYIVTEYLMDKILDLHPTGVSFGMVEISKSDQYEDLYPGRKLPAFVWLKVVGEAGKDDFGLSLKHCLVVSQLVLDVLKESGVSHCDITEYVSWVPKTPVGRQK